MFKGRFSGSNIGADVNIPISVVMNTNSRTGYNTTDNAITINATGYYDVEVVCNITAASTSDIVLTAYADGVAIPGVFGSVAPEVAGDVVTIPLTDVIKVVGNALPTLAELSFQTNVQTTSIDGIVTVKYES